jgi:hypothetical protein
MLVLVLVPPALFFSFQSLITPKPIYMYSLIYNIIMQGIHFIKKVREMSIDKKNFGFLFCFPCFQW